MVSQIEGKRKDYFVGREKKSRGWACLRKEDLPGSQVLFSLKAGAACDKMSGNESARKGALATHNGRPRTQNRKNRLLDSAGN